jgi:di-N-acetylchitobiase
VYLVLSRSLQDLARRNSFSGGHNRQQNCPCVNASLCKPITLAPRPELLAFQTSDQYYTRYDWSKLTTIALFRDQDQDDQIVCVAHSRGVRVVWAANFNVSLLPSSSARSRWVKEMLQTVLNSYTDGINIDVEDPIGAGSSLAPLLTTLTQEANAAFKKAIPTSQVSFDVAWSPNCIDVRCYDYLGLSKATDFLVMMDYDMQSQIKFGPCIAQANSPPNNMISGTVAFLKLGIPSNKLVLGVPWYGYNYTCLNQTNATVCPIALVPFRGVECSDAAGNEVSYGDIINTLLPRSTNGLQWNQIFQSPWFNYNLPSGQAMQVWFDNPRSLAIKIGLAKQLSLGGVAMWNADLLDYSDPGQIREMWETLDNFFN